MGLQTSDFKRYLSINTDDSDDNGGLLDENKLIVSGQADAIHGGILPGWREDGREGENAKAQKFYTKNANLDDIIYSGAFVFIGENITSSTGVTHSIIKGNNTDTWGDVKNNKKYGTGTLNTIPSYDGTNTTITVNTKGEDFAHFEVGDTLFITNLSENNDSTGKIEFHEISAVNYTGATATITIAGALRYAYQVSRILNDVTVYTRAGTCINFGDVKCTYAVDNNTSLHGTYIESNLTPTNLGSIYQIITITFTSSNNFTAVSSVSGIELTNGNRTSTWSPPNPNGGSYLKVPTNFWDNDGSGDWTTGDTIQITVLPPVMPIFSVIDIAPDTPIPEADEPWQINIWTSGLGVV